MWQDVLSLSAFRQERNCNVPNTARCKECPTTSIQQFNINANVQLQSAGWPVLATTLLLPLSDVDQGHYIPRDRARTCVVFH